jgi:hypothetical protein
MMTDTRGASNNKAKCELAWRLRWPSWRDGFSGGLSHSRAAMQGSQPKVLAS